MADRAISDLTAATTVTSGDLFVLEQNSTAKKLTGHTLMTWLLDELNGHGGVQKIEKISTVGLKDTYRMAFTDATTYDFTVTNGRDISSIKKTSTVGLVDTYTITYNDGNKDTFTVTNGAKGDQGDAGFVWIKYASQEPTDASHSMGNIPDEWIGICSGNYDKAPTDWKLYTWYRWKGYQGDAGDKGDRGKSIFYSYSNIEAGQDTTFIPSMIDTRGEELLVGDMILVPSGSLFQITSLPNDAAYVIGAKYLTSLMGPVGPSRDNGTAFYQTTAEPPEELTDRVYMFKLDTISTYGNEIRSGDFIFDSNYNLFRIEAIGASDLRAVWITTWSKDVNDVSLPDYFDYIVLRSSTENSSKRFKVTVDDSGSLTAEEIVQDGTITFRDYMYWGAYEGELAFAVGMTWADFCASAYNTIGLYVSGNQVMEPSGCYMLYQSGSAYFACKPSDTIVDGREYLWDMM